ncbi:MAG: dihydrolipoamide acetyltransferase family protein [Flavobacteriaceae bacterium]|jgi:2-oxoglutarate dehydrogenase E2 component (dihydrolipoamide succinyltransferase)
MAKFELKLPKMGESVAEATINSWLKDIGDRVEVDESVVEISTDKVDSDVPSEVSGILIEKMFDTDAVVEVGQTFAIIETDADIHEPSLEVSVNEEDTSTVIPSITQSSDEVEAVEATVSAAKSFAAPVSSNGNRFYSPLVKNIAKKEGISQAELDEISGSGKAGRVTKTDILDYLDNRKSTQPTSSEKKHAVANPIVSTPSNFINIEATSMQPQMAQSNSNSDEIIEMTRMGKLVAKHMVNSLQTSAHVQSFIEVDVTKVWNWRNKIKSKFQDSYGMKITFTPIFMEAVAKALTLHPMLNISVDGDHIKKHKSINLGMATALADGNLIVPVIKQADQLNLMGLTKRVNDLATRARNNQLNPDDVQDGTYTVTNVGGFGSIMGTPIINQPQVGILALGAIRKVPSVIETEAGDFIGIRQKMFLSHSYDHRVVNGALGGQFIKTVKELLESWDENRPI